MRHFVIDGEDHVAAGTVFLSSAALIPTGDHGVEFVRCVIIFEDKRPELIAREKTQPQMFP
jgi:hypothetical protein